MTQEELDLIKEFDPIKFNEAEAAGQNALWCIAKGDPESAAYWAKLAAYYAFYILARRAE